MAQSIYPTLRYRDAHAAIDWLERAFGAERKDVHEDGGVVVHAEIRIEGDLVMLGTAREEGEFAQIAPPVGTASVYVAIADPDAHHARAVAAGAEVVRELVDLDYGSRDYAVRDPEGNLWNFGTYRPE
jgi:uncharacterized glyoxalase superfamily protein PhnB